MPCAVFFSYETYEISMDRCSHPRASICFIVNAFLDVDLAVVFLKIIQELKVSTWK